MKSLLIAALFLMTSAHADIITGSIKSTTRHIPEFGEDQTFYDFYTDDGKIVNLPNFVNGMAFEENLLITVDAEIVKKEFVNIRSFTVNYPSTSVYPSYSGNLITVDGKVVIETMVANVKLPYLFYSTRLLALNPTVTFSGIIGPGGIVGECEQNCHVVSILQLNGIQINF